MDPEPLRLFLPGAFGHLPDALRALAVDAALRAELWFHEFVPSGMLAAEIEAGATADVFISANRRYMDKLAAAGLAVAPRHLAGNRLCVIALPGHAGQAQTLESLLDSDLTIVTPQSGTDPCGQYIVEMLARAGLSEVAARRERAGTLVHSRGSGDLPAFLFDERAQAGIFYASEAPPLGEQVTVLDLPSEMDMREEIQFWISPIVRDHSVVHPQAGAFVELMSSQQGQRLLAGAGFVPLPTG